MSAGVMYGGMIVFATLMYNKSHVFRYYTRFAFFVLSSMVSATIFIPFMLFRPGDYRNALMPAWAARMTSKILGLKWIMIGHKNIVQDEGSVVLINHQSCLDLQVLAEFWPVLKRCTVISKREIFYFWPFGLATWLWGTVFIDRMSGPNAQAALNKTSQTINTRRAKICMFPEGTRHGGETLLPFKKGAFHIAINSQAPIQPMVVSRYTFLDSKNLIFNKGTSTISILPAIETKGLKKEDLDSLMEKTYKAMSEEYDRLNKAALASH